MPNDLDSAILNLQRAILAVNSAMLDVVVAQRTVQQAQTGGYQPLAGYQPHLTDGLSKEPPKDPNG